MRAAVALALAVVVVTAMGGVGTHAPSAPKARPPRILYVSDWSGSSEIYAVDPGSGRRGQVTFGRAPACIAANPCGYVKPIASPDGRRVVFGDQAIEGPLRTSLFVARADGGGRRRFAQGVDPFYSDPVWSPDSRRIAYAEPDGLHVVNGNGIGARLVDRGQDSDAAWSPDSRSLAFVRRAAAANELVVLHAGVEHVVGESSLSADLRFAWSPTGRWLAYNSTPSIASNPGELDLVRPDGSGRKRLVVSPTSDFAWSPDGRWLAYSSSTSEELDLVRPDGRGRRRLFDASVGGLAWSADGHSLAFCCRNGLLVADVASGSLHPLPSYSGGSFSWSPRGHLLAFSSSDGVRVRDATGRTRTITRDRPFFELWSPDGSSIAYTTSSPTSPEVYLRVASVSGRVRTLFSSSGANGGVLWGFTWTQPPTGIRYRRPAPRTLATVSQHELQAPWPIERLAADGDRVAYVACGHVFVWTPSAREVVQAEPVASMAPNCRAPSYSTNYSVYDLALADERVAYGSVDGGNVRRWWLGGTELGRTPSFFTLGQNMETNGGPFGQVVGQLEGASDLLVFGLWDEAYAPDHSRIVTTKEDVQRAEPGGCTCPTLASSPGPLVPLDLDQGRIVAGGDKATWLLDASGKRLLTLPVSPLAAQLSGSDLVLLVQGELRDYDAASGALRHAWPLPDVPSGRGCDTPDGVGCTGSLRLVLEDVARGLVTYVFDGQVHLVRFADGADATVAPGTHSRFTDTGLVYAEGRSLHLVPFDRLPLR